MLIEPDPEEGEEDDQEAIQARAPPDLDARIPFHKEEDPLPLEGEHQGGAETPIREIAPQSPPADREDVIRREDSLLREAIPHSPLHSDTSDDPEQITDYKWINALKGGADTCQVRNPSKWWLHS